MARKKKEEPKKALMGELYDIAMGRRSFDDGGEEVSLNERLKAFELIAKYQKLPENEGEKQTVVIIDDIGEGK